MEYFMPDNNKNIGGFPSNGRSADEPKSPDNEAGNQNPGIEINRKTERSASPEKSAKN